MRENTDKYLKKERGEVVSSKGGTSRRAPSLTEGPRENFDSFAEAIPVEMPSSELEIRKERRSKLVDEFFALNPHLKDIYYTIREKFIQFLQSKKDRGTHEHDSHSK